MIHHLMYTDNRCYQQLLQAYRLRGRYKNRSYRDHPQYFEETRKYLNLYTENIPQMFLLVCDHLLYQLQTSLQSHLNRMLFHRTSSMHNTLPYQLFLTCDMIKRDIMLQHFQMLYLTQLAFLLEKHLE